MGCLFCLCICFFWCPASPNRGWCFFWFCNGCGDLVFAVFLAVMSSISYYFLPFAAVRWSFRGRVVFAVEITVLTMNQLLLLWICLWDWCCSALVLVKQNLQRKKNNDLIWDVVRHKPTSI
jgi:hypothetical protein